MLIQTRPEPSITDLLELRNLTNERFLGLGSVRGRLRPPDRFLVKPNDGGTPVFEQHFLNGKRSNYSFPVTPEAGTLIRYVATSDAEPSVPTHSWHHWEEGLFERLFEFVSPEATTLYQNGKAASCRYQAWRAVKLKTSKRIICVDGSVTNVHQDDFIAALAYAPTLYAPMTRKTIEDFEFMHDA